MGLPWFDPKGVFLAWRGDELLGFHWTKWHGHEGDAPHAPVGEVYVLAIHPRAQGLGLGRRLLRTGLAHLHERDCREAILYVDRASRGAVKLYVSEDFALEYLDVCYEDEVAASPPAPVVELLRPA